MPAPSVATPCTKVCVIDEGSGLCLGCLRTLAEIAGWGALTDADRARVMAELPGRRPASAPETPGSAPLTPRKA